MADSSLTSTSSGDPAQSGDPLGIDRHAEGLCEYVDASPSPFHAVANAAATLRAAGYLEVDERLPWSDGVPERGYVLREGSLIAWSTRGIDASTATSAAGMAATPAAGTGFRVVGAHTDSPNLRIRPNPDTGRAGWDQLGVEIYGGPLVNSWLDRDLGLSGRVAVRCSRAQDSRGYRVRLFEVNEPLLRLPQLAIHLDRAVSEEGVKLNPQTQLVPVWGATGQAPDFSSYLAGVLDVDPADVLSWDAMTHDLTPSGRLGHAGDLLVAPRLDNLTTSYAAVQALLAADAATADGSGSGSADGAPQRRAIVLFDHEEIGSMTNRGGMSQFLPAILERIVLAQGGDRDAVLASFAASVVASGDVAHAVHPNYTERYEPEHLIHLGGGPVLKVNARGRYATDTPGAAEFALACEQAGVPMQAFVTRGDVACGSTIGPMTSALMGCVTFDVGSPVLSMHSARELSGWSDPAAYVASLGAFLAPRN